MAVAVGVWFGSSGKLAPSWQTRTLGLQCHLNTSDDQVRCDIANIQIIRDMIINRPGLAEAVLQTPSSFIH